MTLRETADAAVLWATTFWDTITAVNALDWPLSYFLILGVAGLVAFYAVIFAAAIIVETIKSVIKR